jgi:DNA-binding winged helix-turn-helix (wHTH) protein/tetratricopeptide (TPR) repeat protein
LAVPIFRFETFELDSEARRLTRDGEEVAIGPRVFDLVAYLLEHRRRAVGRDELISAVWGRTDSSDAVLAQAILKARRAFGDGGDSSRCIRTVPRFGYQWAAPVVVAAAAGSATDVMVAAAPADDGAVAVPRTMEDGAGDGVVARSTRHRAISRAWPWIALALGLAAAAILLVSYRQHTADRVDPADPASTGDPDLVPGLVLVTPTTVRSGLAEDGWMRLGIMSLNTHALASLPGHTVVPDEAVIAALAGTPDDADVERLRRRTGAAIVVSSTASRIGGDWMLEAIVRGPDQARRMLSARASDPVAAASSLAAQLHDVLAPGRGGGEAEQMRPQVLALVTRMRAAILDGRNGRALTLPDAMPPDVATAPEVTLQKVEALIQLGRAQEAIMLLRDLLDAAGTAPVQPWVAAAWSALGDCELSLGDPAGAEGHFRRAIAALGERPDHRIAGLAWRGLGIAQSMRNDLAGAEASYRQARIALEPIGDRLVLARIVNGFGYVAAQRGRLGDALLRYQEAASIAAAFGSNETELGMRLNIVLTREYLLQHSLALRGIRELLPRMAHLDYPALWRLGTVAHARSLAETGAWAAAREELDRIGTADAGKGGRDAVVDTRIDEAQIRVAIGDYEPAIRLLVALRAAPYAYDPGDRRLQAAALLLQAWTTSDPQAAAALVADAATWEPADALPAARSAALTALASWHARQGDAARAAGEYDEAMTAALAMGAPVVVRDAALPYLAFLQAQGAWPKARQIAGHLGEWAEDDFGCALALARVAAADADAERAQSYYSRARALAGERWTEALSAEAAAAADPVVDSP